MREPSTYKEKYAEQLSNHGKGVAVWHPAPNEQLDGTFKSIALGDVGYFFNGSFVKLFNVASARVARVLDNNQVCETYPANLLEDAYIVQSEENRFTSKSVQARITTVDSRNEIAQLSANLTCAGVSGAALIIPSHTRPGIVSRDLKHRATYAEHCFRHWREWLSVAQDQATKHVSLKDLIFVSGIDYVHMWSLFSFQRPSQTRTVRLYVGPSTVSGSFDGDDPIMNFGPRKRPLNPSTCFPGYDQCVFIRRFKMHGRVEQLRWRTERLLRGPRVVTINEPEPIQIPLDTTNPNVDSQSTRDNNPGREVQISIDSPYMQRSQEGNDEDDASEGVHGEADEGTSHDKVSSRKARRRNRRRGGDEEPGIAHGGNHRRGGGAGGAPAKGPPGNGEATGLIHPGSAPQGSDWQGGSSGGARGGIGTQRNAGFVAQYPHSDFSDSDSSSKVESDTSGSKSDLLEVEPTDPLDSLLSYILEECPNAQFSFAGDEDLVQFKEHLDDWVSFPSILKSLKPKVCIGPGGWASLASSLNRQEQDTLHQMRPVRQLDEVDRIALNKFRIVL